MGEQPLFPELFDVNEIEERGIDWYKRGNTYIRHMCMSYLPGYASPHSLNALLNEDVVTDITVYFNKHTVEANDTSQIAALATTINRVLDESKIYRKARNKIIKEFADDLSINSSKNVVDMCFLARIEASSKSRLEAHTDIVNKKAEQAEIGVIPFQGEPEVAERAIIPTGGKNKEISIEHTVDPKSSAKIFHNMVVEMHENKH